MTVAAGIGVPALIAASMVLLPSEEDRMAAVALENQEAALQRKADEEAPQHFVLQPFYVPGGALIVEVTAKGLNGLSSVCSNLPIVHDAVITQLDADGRLYGGNDDYTPDSRKFRQAINSSFRKRPVLDVDVTYQPDTAVALAGKRKVGTSTRCLSLQKSTRHAAN
jgi:hypothetical protein